VILSQHFDENLQDPEPLDLRKPQLFPADQQQQQTSSGLMMLPQSKRLVPEHQTISFNSQGSANFFSHSQDSQKYHHQQPVCS
jgi:hypothetical protein